jgi:polar amino acid transport system permease protein
MSFDWPFFWERLVNPGDAYITALGRTIVMAVLAMALGVLIGVIVGFGRLSRFGLLRGACAFYVWFVRGIPVLVLLVLLFSGLAAAGLFRFSDVTILGFSISASFQAAVVALAIHEGAYMAEIVRNGIQAVARGQIEAAKSVGMGTWLLTRRIVLPQATRVIVPPLGNDFNHMLKTTSLASVIGVQEIFQLTESMSATTFRTFELLIAVSLTYLTLTTVWNVAQGIIETKLRAHELDVSVKNWRQAVQVYFRTGIGSAAERRS